MKRTAAAGFQPGEKAGQSGRFGPVDGGALRPRADWDAVAATYATKVAFSCLPAPVQIPGQFRETSQV